MYFYKKGKGRYKPAPAQALKAALASVERKHQQALLQARYVVQLGAGRLPDEFAAVLPELLYKPDRGTLEVKALEQAAHAAGLSAAHLIERCGAIPSTHDYHLNRFLLEHVLRGTGFADFAAPAVPDDLPQAQVEAFSIDDVTTTEIDDAFSVRSQPQGGWEVGVHIAAPALFFGREHRLESLARERLSTVYFPGGKITMLPEAAIAEATLSAGREVAAASLYLDLDPDTLAITASESRLERVAIATNLRIAELETRLNAESLAAGRVEGEHGEDLMLLWRLACKLRAGRGAGEG